MKDLRHILGKKIKLKELDLELHCITLDEYQDYSGLFGALTLTKNLFLQNIDNKNKPLRDCIDKNIDNFDVMCLDGQGILSLAQLFQFVFQTKDITSNHQHIIKEIINKDLLKWDSPNDINKIIEYTSKIVIHVDEKEINRDNFNYVRNMILKCSGISLSKQAKNKELQEWFDKDAKAKNQGASKIDMEDVLIAIMKEFHYTPEQISQLTLYQVNKFLEKINSKDEYDRNIQFLCAGAKDIKLSSWIEHKEEKSDSTDFNSFKNTMSSILGSKQ